MRTTETAAFATLPTTLMESTANAVRAVRALRTTAELFEAAPKVVAALGFDRVILSDVAEKMWVPLDVYMPRDAGWGKEILEASRTSPQRLNNGLVENEILQARRHIVVEGVQRHPRVNQAIASASRSDAYLAVPIILGEEVGGFIHADRYWHGGRFDARDATQVEVFAEAFGMALERAHLVERLAGLGRELDVEACSARPRADLQAGPVVARAYRPHLSLTNRENDIAELITDGLTNPQIAEALVLSEATIKSHVKHILRKLGAAHRAEAVSILLRTP